MKQRVGTPHAYIGESMGASTTTGYKKLINGNGAHPKQLVHARLMAVRAQMPMHVPRSGSCSSCTDRKEANHGPPTFGQCWELFFMHL